MTWLIINRYVTQLLKAPFVKTYNIIKTQAGNELEEVREKIMKTKKLQTTKINKFIFIDKKVQQVNTPNRT